MKDTTSELLLKRSELLLKRFQTELNLINLAIKQKLWYGWTTSIKLKKKSRGNHGRYIPK